ncbi:granzyme-like protein 1 isoform X7 [Anticarsia gemmatalis]|uniref:granzyme-like protein 1 isoform X7 n=1 Tax=Anticarsia gemmatalis TaxID=129554 RepID=UPI003F758659
MLFHIFVFLFVSHVGSEHVPEGTPCSWGDVKGQCVSVYRCLSAVKDIENRNYPPTCSYNGTTPIICCTDCELVPDTRLYIFNPVLGILIKSGTSRAKDKCIEFIHKLNYPCKEGMHDLIITPTLEPDVNCAVVILKIQPQRPVFGVTGGHDVERNDYPHMALLGYGESIDTADWLCGGSVISERFILTAAHCVSGPNVGKVKYIGLGILRRSDPPEQWQRYNVKTIITHPGYKPPSKYHDIALLETDREIAFNRDVRPACLHVDDQIDNYATATGWGALGHRRELSDTLQAVGLHLFTPEECSQNYPKHRHLLNGYDHTTQMCYGDRMDTNSPTDTCAGDSGGPLQSIEHERCVYTILGVTSYGRECGTSGGTGMYTRVRPYVSWIEDIVWPL